MDAWQSVASSVIDAVAYDGASRTMKVRFKGGAVHHYHDVPPEVPDEMISAPSAGRHFHDMVKDQYRSSRG